MALLATTLLTASVAIDAQPRCRCLPGDPCWASVDWAALNRSVHGRLVKTFDELAPCVANISSPVCAA